MSEPVHERGDAHVPDDGSVERELAWFRSVMRRLPDARLERPTLALLAHLAGGPGPKRTDFPARREQVEDVRRALGRMPPDIASRASTLLDEYSAGIGDASSSKAQPASPERGREGWTGPRYRFSRHDGAYELRTTASSSVGVEGAASLAEALGALGAPEPAQAARALALVGGAFEDAVGIRTIGDYVEDQLGVPRTRGSAPDLGFYEVKTRFKGGDRPFTCLFGSAPTWLAERRTIVKRFGRNGLVDSRIGGPRDRADGRLALRRTGPVVRVVTRDDRSEPLLEWQVSAVEAALERKAPAIVELIGSRRGQTGADVVEGLVFWGLRPKAFGELIGHRNLYVRVIIPRRAHKGTYEFNVNRAALRRLYTNSVSVRPVTSD